MKNIFELERPNEYKTYLPHKNKKLFGSWDLYKKNRENKIKRNRNRNKQARKTRQRQRKC